MTAPRAALLILCVAVAAVVGARVYESLGYLPCDLCLLQRKPFYAAMPLAAATAVFAWSGATRLSRVGFALLAALFLVGVGLAAYHSGVEWKIFAGPSDCTGDPQRAASMEEFYRQLLSVKVVRCDRPSLFLFGLTLANWNAALSLALAGFSGWALRLRH